MATTIIDTTDSLCRLLEEIESLSPHPHFLFIDLEGVNLSRHGSIAIMQVFVPATGTVYLVDVRTLGRQAFETPSATGTTLKTILQSSECPKVFFDVRHDSDALYHHFQVDLRGVVDLQLLEFATRRVHGRFVKGLSKCISETIGLSWEELSEFQKVKNAGLQLFAPEKGGSYEVFNERPLSTAIIKYCVQDVTILPKVLLAYGSRLRNELAVQVHAETLRRITLSQSPYFDGNGRHMARGPFFELTSASGQSSVCFPLSIVCSKDLSKYCSLRTPKTTGRAEQIKVDTVVDPAQPQTQSQQAPPMESLLTRLGFLSVKEPLRRNANAGTIDEDEEADLYSGPSSRKSF